LLQELALHHLHFGGVPTVLLQALHLALVVVEHGLHLGWGLDTLLLGEKVELCLCIGWRRSLLVLARAQLHILRKLLSHVGALFFAGLHYLLARVVELVLRGLSGTIFLLISLLQKFVILGQGLRGVHVVLLRLHEILSRAAHVILEKREMGWRWHVLRVRALLLHVGGLLLELLVVEVGRLRVVLFVVVHFWVGEVESGRALDVKVLIINLRRTCLLNH
jgi:hypothetical protein